MHSHFSAIAAKVQSVTRGGGARFLFCSTNVIIPCQLSTNEWKYIMVKYTPMQEKYKMWGKGGGWGIKGIICLCYAILLLGIADFETQTFISFRSRYGSWNTTFCCSLCSKFVGAVCNRQNALDLNQERRDGPGWCWFAIYKHSD